MVKVQVRDVKVGSSYSLISYEDSFCEFFRKGSAFVYVEDYEV